MTGFKEYHKYDAIGLAELVKRKKISPAELCEEAIARIEKVNPKINAVIRPLFSEARQALRSKLPLGPFTGVPFLLKDLLAAYAGIPLTSGSRAYRDYVPDFDSEMVARFKKAGLVTIGKTSTPEFGLKGITEPDIFGPCRNPWDLERTPGGSSGGSAAAVAAGIVPMASGGDGGGSIRIPASYCGLFGLKPSRGRNPTGPEFGMIWQGAAVEHVITRSVRDSAAALDATCGADTGPPYIIPLPERPYIDEIKRKPRKLRIGFTTRSPLGMDVDRDCVSAVKDAARLLSELGHEVTEAAPEYNGVTLAKSYLRMYFGEVAADVAAARKLTGRRPRRKDFEIDTWTLALMGQVMNSGEFVLSMREWNVAGRAMGRFFESHDLFLTPTTAVPPVRIGELDLKPVEKFLSSLTGALRLRRLVRLTGIVEKLFVMNLSRTPFTQISNLTGLPAMSVPLFWNGEGLPCGVHFTAPFGDEVTLLRLAAQLEKARPWFDRIAPVHSSG